MNELPKQPGAIWTNSHDQTAAPTTTSKYSLSDLATDWHFFNHGALFTYAGMRFPSDDPLNDWYAQQPKGTQVLKEAFSAKIFEGLPTFAGNGTWDHVICGVRHENWQSLWSFLCGVATADREKHLYRQVFSGDVEIMDPVLIERFSIFNAPLVKVPITVFCVDGNDKRWEIEPVTNPMGVVKFVERPPRRKVLEMAALILDGDTSTLKDNSNQAITTILQEELAKWKSNSTRPAPLKVIGS